MKNNAQVEQCDKFLEATSRKPGFKVRKDKHGYPYHINTTRMNTDPFVRKAMKLYDKEVYDSCDGFTKKTSLSKGLESLMNFGDPERSVTALNSDDKMRRCYEEAVNEARTRFMPQDKLLKRHSLETATDYMEKDTAAGFSFPGKKKAEVIEELFDISSYILHQVRHGYYVYETPCKLAFRGHLSPADDPKTRPIWVYPAEINILESMWGQPYYDWLESQDVVMNGPGTMPRLRKEQDEWIGDADEGQVDVTYDWSNFDSRVPNWLIDIAFDIIGDSFDKTKWMLYDKEVEWPDEGYDRVWGFLRKYFKKTPIMLPNGKVVVKQHGVPSGALLTQAVDSIVNFIKVRALTKYQGLQVTGLSILGDDSRFRTAARNRRLLESSVISPIAWQFFGSIMKEDKVKVGQRSTERKFIGYEVQGGLFTRQTEDWFKLVLYSERDIESLEISASRVIAYYLLGGVNDLQYCEFLRFFFTCYPQVVGKSLPPERSMLRLLKYVFRLPSDTLKVPDVRLLSIRGSFQLMGFGGKPFG